MRLIIFSVVTFICTSLFSQQQLLPLNHEDGIAIETVINQSDQYMHTSFKPFLSLKLREITDSDSLLYGYKRDSSFISKRKYKWFWRKLRTEDFIIVDTSDFMLVVNPLLNIQSGINTVNDSSLFVNTRGIMVKGNVGKTLSFYSDFYENQAKFPGYIRDYITERNVIPGQGRNSGFKGTGQDYSHAAGYLSFAPKEWLNFQFGHYKNFIGEGYRSLLLSDVSYNYPFVKACFTSKRVQYIYMLSSHQNIPFADGRWMSYQKKYGSYNFINILVNKRLQVGILEAVMWKTTTESSNNVFTLNYFNPIIFSRSLQYGLNDDNNILLGFTTKVKIHEQLQLYGQYVLDNLSREYTGDKTGYQIGAKILEPLKVKNLFLQVEFNKVQPYTYAHNNTIQSYTNANEALAHPLGAGFEEYFGRLRYHFKDFYLDVKFSRATSTRDTLGSHLGTNIYVSDSTAMLLSVGNEDLTVDIRNASMQIGYILNPRTNLQLFAGCHYREFINNHRNVKTSHIFFGIRTSLYSYYYDF